MFILGWSASKLFLKLSRKIALTAKTCNISDIGKFVITLQNHLGSSIQLIGTEEGIRTHSC